MNTVDPNIPEVNPALSKDKGEAVIGQTSSAGNLNNQALLCYEQGKYLEAEALYKQALVISELVVGDEQTDLSFTLNSLANLYYEQGKFIQAEPLSKRALAIREKALGPDHQDVAESLVLYAKLLRKKNFNYKAAQLEARANRDFIIRLPKNSQGKAKC
jgi:tetratricopeptide (TPR) repeat protein